MANVLGVSPQCAKTWNRHRLIRGHAYNGKNECLYEHPGDKPPRKAQGVKLSQRAALSVVVTFGWRDGAIRTLALPAPPLYTSAVLYAPSACWAIRNPT